MNKLKERILKEMVTNLDEVQRRFRDEIYEDISSRELKPEFRKMSLGGLINYIEERLSKGKTEE